MPSDTQEPAPVPQSQVVHILRDAPDPTSSDDGRSLLHTLLTKAALARPTGQTNAGETSGIRPALIDKQASRNLQRLNPTHAICLEAKVSSSVGMGHREQSIYEALDPLCRFGWQDVLDAAGQDLAGEGECFIEAAMSEDGRTIRSLNHLDGASVDVVVESSTNSEQYHYLVSGLSYGSTTESVVMASWGDLADLKRRYAAGRTDGLVAGLSGRIVDSQIIHVRQPTARDPYRGFPDWVAAVPFVELVQMMVRHEFDFHYNRGVPELLVTLIGGQVTQKDWDKIVQMLQASQGVGNSRKSAALRLTGSPDSVAVQVDKLSDEGAREHFGDNADSMSMMIATAHGVPPLLANILLPGKIGAANEGPNALMLFQKRKLGQIQKRISASLARTLGGARLLTPDGIQSAPAADVFLGRRFDKSPEDPDSKTPIYHEPGNGFRTVLDGMQLGAMDTMARMREPMAGSGRNPADGLLGGTDDRKPGDPRRTR
jgi:hypothetical protein